MLKESKSELEELIKKELLSCAYKYQQEVIEDKSSIVIANWSRGFGKTFTSLCKVLKDNPKYVLYISPLNAHESKSVFKRKIEEINNLIKQFKIYIVEDINDHITIMINNNRINIIFINNFKNDCQRNRFNKYYDLIIYDEILPINNYLRSKQLLSFVTINNSKLSKLFYNSDISFHQCGLKQGLTEGVITNEEIQKMMLYNENFKNEIDILSEFTELKTRREEIISIYKETNKNKFLIDTLVRLEEELDKLSNQNNTVMTREKILDMILKIKNELDKKE